MQPGRRSIDALVIQFESGVARIVIPRCFSRSGNLALVREVEPTRFGVRERAGWSIVHVHTGRPVKLLDRLQDAARLLNMIDVRGNWDFQEANSLGEARAIEACSNLLREFPEAIRA